ncbi:MAG: hypothetical protein ACI837_001097 [Crocinitomicaceae bacterium]|jgi:hypothetical protein
MRLLLTFVLVSFTFVSTAKSRGISQIEYTLESSELDANLPESESVYEFQFSGIVDTTFTILYSVDGENGQTSLTQDGKLTICAKPGKHIFQFFTWHYSEIFTDSIEIKPQYRDLYTVNMTFSQVIQTTAKPVIYLYPEVSTQVSVQIDIVGANPFYYPSYDGRWECMVLPNGKIHMGDNSYNYLFWEAESIGTTLLHREGFIVQKNDVVSFLEKQLSSIGFTSKEQADFITYWAPKLIQNDQNFIQFMFNDACDELAELNISPTPDNIYRIYMLWQPTETTFEVKEQEMLPINRAGFSVLEWGGMELAPLTLNESL